MDIYEYLEDFDNSELTETEWVENMKDRVREFNEENFTNHNPATTVNNYISKAREEKFKEPRS